MNLDSELPFILDSYVLSPVSCSLSPFLQWPVSQHSLAPYRFPRFIKTYGPRSGASPLRLVVGRTSSLPRVQYSLEHTVLCLEHQTDPNLPGANSRTALRRRHRRPSSRPYRVLSVCLSVPTRRLVFRLRVPDERLVSVVHSLLCLRTRGSAGDGTHGVILGTRLLAQLDLKSNRYFITINYKEGLKVDYSLFLF